MTTRILLVQLADIGDLILTTPALSALREAHPDAHLTLLTTAHSAKVVERELVDEVLTLDRKQLGTLGFFSLGNLRELWQLRAMGFEVVVFFHHFTYWLGTLKFALIAWMTGAKHVIGLENGNGWFLTVRVTDDGFGAKHQAQYWLDLVATLGADADARRARVAFDGGILPLSATTQPRVVIHTGSGGYSVARRWLPQYFAQVANALAQEFNAQLVFVGTPDDGFDDVKPYLKTNTVNLVGKTTLTQLADIIRSAELFIGADSGIMHLAAAVRTPTIALFGSSSAEAWGAWSPQGTVAILRSGVLCSPCSYVGHRVGARDGCKARTCMRLLTPAMVVETARAILQGRAILPTYRPPQPLPTYPQRARFLGLWHDLASVDDALMHLEMLLQRSAFHLCIWSDYQRALRATHDPILRVIYERAAFVWACGTGMAWAGNWKRTYLPERVLVLPALARLLERASAKGWRVFLLGRVATLAREALKETLPALQVVGAYNADAGVEDEDAVVEAVAQSGADLLLVGFGGDDAEKWMARNAPRLRVRVGVGIGALLEDIAGLTPMPPLWMREWGIGWLYMLMRQPHRWRTLWDAPRFVVRTLFDRIR
jgi:heptosyltransferase-2